MVNFNTQSIHKNHSSPTTSSIIVFLISALPMVTAIFCGADVLWKTHDCCKGIMAATESTCSVIHRILEKQQLFCTSKKVCFSRVFLCHGRLNTAHNSTDLMSYFNSHNKTAILYQNLYVHHYASEFRSFNRPLPKHAIDLLCYCCSQHKKARNHHANLLL